MIADLKPQQAFKDANFKVLYQTVPHEVWLTVVAFTFTLGSLAALAVLRLLCIHIYLMRHNTSTYTDIDEESLSISEAYTPQKVDSYTSGATLNSGSFTIELVTDLPWVSTVQTTRSAKKNNNHCKLVVVNETCPCCDQPDNSSGCSLEVVSLATCSADL
ncbi:hypothetical protein DPMN_107443 [Dreissena polymorpha]|uniref:Uncharacterized protein n=1 Tax=Dreissena polymorpha TaxID=45954 RepID=A0A9D4K723_DREPO|nr:hypothetical protein DPMN_107443 [Dreissena polymorpha]